MNPLYLYNKSRWWLGNNIIHGFTALISRAWKWMYSVKGVHQREIHDCPPTSTHLNLFLKITELPIIWKNDVIHTTGSMQRTVLSSEKDRATFTGYMYRRKIRKIWNVVSEDCVKSEQTYRQPDIQTHWSQYYSTYR